MDPIEYVLRKNKTKFVFSRSWGKIIAKAIIFSQFHSFSEAQLRKNYEMEKDGSRLNWLFYNSIFTLLFYSVLFNNATNCSDFGDGTRSVFSIVLIIMWMEGECAQFIFYWIFNLILLILQVHLPWKNSQNLYSPINNLKLFFRKHLGLFHIHFL